MKYILLLMIGLATQGCADHSVFGDGTEENCQVSKEDGITKLLCNGEVIEIADGQDGSNGNDGSNGTDGTNGNDGIDGIDGEDGIDGLITEVIDPCGDDPGTPYDEVLLVLNNGDILAYFAGSTTLTSRLAILQEGVVYTTTDGTSCNFSIVLGAIVYP